MNNDEIEAVRESLGFIRSYGQMVSNRAYHAAHNDDPVWEKLVIENLAKKRYDRYGWVIYHPTIECAREADLVVKWFSGTGAGGQHRNKKQNSCRLTHVPSGIVVTAQTRDRKSSLAQATKELRERVDKLTRSGYSKRVEIERSTQRGSGMRGDKIRTYRFQDDSVTDHRTNRSAKASRVMRGAFDLLW